MVIIFNVRFHLCIQLSEYFLSSCWLCLGKVVRPLGRRASGLTQDEEQASRAEVHLCFDSESVSHSVYKWPALAAVRTISLCPCCEGLLSPKTGGETSFFPQQ